MAKSKQENKKATKKPEKKSADKTTKKTKKKPNKTLRKAKKQAERRTRGLRSLTKLPLQTWRFLKSVRNELKEVDWLSRQDTVRWTSAVIGTALLFGLLMVLLDLGFFELRDLLFEI
ncbi:preprotein translocase subunit SecE [Candidatus Dojkabacteria bacterium]|nr:preprotein translocase subunit SecE [Candidatus Dojkabacteria bacterium]